MPANSDRNRNSSNSSSNSDNSNPAKPAAPTSHIPATPSTPTNTNRQNAQASTGPRSPEGKSASSKNATTHGLTVTSHAILKTAQDKTDFDSLRDALLSDLQPAPGLEQVFFNHILIATWNMQRCDAHMAALSKRGLDPLDMTFTGSEIATTTTNIGAYHRRNERSLHKALDALRELQSERTYREIAESKEKTKNISTLVRTQPFRGGALREDHLKTQIETLSIRNAKQFPDRMPVTTYGRNTSARILKAV